MFILASMTILVQLCWFVLSLVGMSLPHDVLLAHPVWRVFVTGGWGKMPWEA